MFRTPTVQLSVNGGSQHPDKRRAGGHGPTLADEVEHLLPTPTAELNAPASWRPGVVWWLQSRATRNLEGVVTGNTPLLAACGQRPVTDWGPYARSVLRWAQVTGALPPHPAEPGRTGMRLSPLFVEWMMGLPAGWVTDIALARSEQLGLLGSGVVPQQGALAVAVLLRRAGLGSLAWQTA